MSLLSLCLCPVLTICIWVEVDPASTSRFKTGRKGAKLHRVFPPFNQESKAFPETLQHLLCLIDQACVMKPTLETKGRFSCLSPKVRFCNNKKGTDGDRTMNTVSSDEPLILKGVSSILSLPRFSNLKWS